MSTLIELLLAVVVSILGGDLKENDTLISKNETRQIVQDIPQSECFQTTYIVQASQVK
ncbi:hypothetical protein [Cochleicola gelatinilyticus]|uniref:hypothetical protein n=1 Tax=Cochleicola gelatinilyticus TaxID=1763537 RepID=UPI0012FAF12B|nr:hypothetical protein [Cochleicola gelatinilyticus]